MTKVLVTSQRWNGSGADRAGGDDAASVLPHLGSQIDRNLLGMLMFLATEAMFFAGLISAFLILRAGNASWPPAGQPRLPVLVTGINTLILLISALTVYRASRAVLQERPRALTGWLALTAVLGLTFLTVQGYEWVRLVGYGLSISSGVYGGTFYTLIGAHGLHVLAAVIALLLVLVRAVGGRYSRSDHSGVMLCQVYWFFVVGVWPVLYILVYLS